MEGLTITEDPEGMELMLEGELAERAMAHAARARMSVQEYVEGLLRQALADGRL